MYIPRERGKICSSIIISCVPKKYVKEGKVDYHTIIITNIVLVYIEIFYPMGSKWEILENIAKRVVRVNHE